MLWLVGGTKTTAKTLAAFGAVPMTAVPFGIFLPLGTQASPGAGAGLVLAANGKVKAAPLTRVPLHTSVAAAGPAAPVLAPPALVGGTKTTARAGPVVFCELMTAVPFAIFWPLGMQASPAAGAGLALGSNSKVKAAPVAGRVPWHTSLALAEPAALVLPPPAVEGGTKTTARAGPVVFCELMTAVPFAIFWPVGMQASPAAGAGLALGSNSKV